jgi:DNA-binding HxlR family transcriptional regulator
LDVASTGDYCAFTKTVEHLGDRWSLVIIRELLIHGTCGFNALADGMPGISRSVLAARLRKLKDVGLIERERGARGGVPGYCLSYAGRQLQPVLHGLWSWSERFVPEDPAMAERDPDIVVKWLSQRVDRNAIPERRVVVDLDIEGTRVKRGWLVLERGVEPSICIEDPCLSGDRYVFVECDVHALYPIARGLRDWSEAIADGSIRLSGEPELIRALPTWFQGHQLHGQRDAKLLEGRSAPVTPDDELVRTRRSFSRRVDGPGALRIGRNPGVSGTF